MLNHPLFIIIIGCLLGFFSGLGVGGGSLLMLWLTLVVNMEYSAARTINLLFFIPTAVIATFFRWRQGAVDIKKILPAIIAGCISAALFATISRQIDTFIIRKLFGVLLIITGLRELFYHPRNAK